MKGSTQVAVLLLGSLAGCASIRAPEIVGSSWTGQDSDRLVAEIRYPIAELPTGWLHRTERGEANGSFAYRKRSGTYDFSERGHFEVDSSWLEGRDYIGHLKAGGIFCVANPERQSSETDDATSGMTTITFYTYYDFCVQLHGR